jgi:hypothetical protein
MYMYMYTVLNFFSSDEDYVKKYVVTTDVNVYSIEIPSPMHTLPNGIFLENLSLDAMYMYEAN